jgi:hypothetical protein
VDRQLAKSRSEARRIIATGQVRVDGVPVLDIGATVDPASITERCRSAKYGQHALAGEEERTASGKFRQSILCDCCGMPIGDLDKPGNHFTDDEVCGSSDGPGFFLCSRRACSIVYRGKSVDERREIFTAGRERIKGIQHPRTEKVKEKPAGPTNAEMHKVLDAFQVNGPTSHLIGLGMIANLLGCDEEHAERVATQLVNFGRFQRLADNAWKRTL